jgi:hypothetical protein
VRNVNLETTKNLEKLLNLSIASQIRVKKETRETIRKRTRQEAIRIGKARRP